ncbi:MAG: NAD-dependent epimerase/dehydratase family protein [Acidimicrobiales bacterium]|nr:NAD-dependent epimerase/dehydratase family protein [Acidimicrobiales bacterium]
MTAAPPVVVTGAGGWLGRNLVRALAPERDIVRVLVERPDEAPLLELAGPSVEPVVGDVRDPVVVDRLFEDMGGATVFHAAGVIHPAGRTRPFFDVNVGGTQLVVDRAQRAAAGRFVHISSNSPFGANARPSDRFTEESDPNPYLGYGRSKAEAESIVVRSAERGDLDAIVLRPPWFYGPWGPDRQAQFLRAVRTGRFPLVGNGRQQRSMIHSRNLVEACRCAEAATEGGGRAYWVADAEPYELRSIFDGIRAAMEAEGLPVSRWRGPRLPRLGARVAVHGDRVLQALDRYVQPLHVLGELGDTIACDIAAARRDLGYRPRVGLVEGMRESIRWHRDRGDAL